MIHSARFPWGDSVCTLVFCTESGVHHSLLCRNLEILDRNVPPCCCLRLLGAQFSLPRYLGVLSSLRPFVTPPAAFCECLRGFSGRSRAAGSRAKEEHGRSTPSLGRSPPAAVPKQRVTSRRHGRGPAGGEPERVRSAAAAAAHTARPNCLGHARNRPSPLKGKSRPNAQSEKEGAARGPERPRPASGCQQLSPRLTPSAGRPFWPDARHGPTSRPWRPRTARLRPGIVFCFSDHRHAPGVPAKQLLSARDRREQDDCCY
ncbi:hypothetical protein NDU88_005403 [Pleurodeles waltl]|uniref:Uncharacterized protein n=1 Tax=Pleurodeles waltl TaxID=8319 RepID=A0AAV7LL75_PLEWA|nr:hypothetical protein NDU88_005403 [Pleurodeles waltl]